jgi:adenylyltransferase/sulfurtransferase
MLLGEVGEAGQRRLKGASVICIGAGGLGSPLLMYLAAAGVGRIGLVDFDVVDASNLHRQIVHGHAAIGRSKVASARDRLLDLNPDVHVDAVDAPLTHLNALDLLAGYDVVVDGTDNFPTRYLVDDACAMLGKPNVHGAVYRFEGQASVFHHDGGPAWRDLHPTPPPPGLVPSCAEAGVLGVVPGVIGTIQATEVLKILLGVGETLSGRLLLFDARAMRFDELTIRRDPRRRPPTHLDEVVLPGCEVPSGWTRLAPDAVRARRGAGWAPYVLDVRGIAEAAARPFAGADCVIPHDALAAGLVTLPRDRDLLVLCRSGGRSTQAARALAAAGFDPVFELDGGLSAWERAG